MYLASMIKRLVFAVLAALAPPAAAHEYQLGDLVIDHPFAFETPVTARTGAGYVMITNNGTTNDRLLAVEADFPRVMLHTTEVDGDVTRMVHLMAVDLPAGETVMFQPGAMHIMFMGLDAPFAIGDSFPATLVFENAGTIDVEFKVEARTDADHDTMDHSSHDGH